MTLRLVLPWLVLILLGAVGAISRSRPPWARLMVTLVLMAGLTASLVPLVGSALGPRYDLETGRFAVFASQLLVAVWWILVARLLIMAGRIALGINRHHPPTRLASDLVAGAVYLGSVLAILDLVFGVSVTGLVATSGVIAIVLGLALQSTLSDLFSGVALGLDRPFKTGDMVWIEGGIEGRIVETNWRSTRLATTTDDVATVPNSVVAKSRLRNRSAPDESHSGSVRLVLDASILPRHAIEVLQAACRTVSLLSADPAPTVLCTDLRGEGGVYEVTFSAALAEHDAARSDLLHQVACHLHYAGLSLAPQDGSALVRRPAPGLVDILRDVGVLHSLTEAELAELQANVVRHQGVPGTTIFDQSGSKASMFIVARGAFEVCRDDGSGERRLGTIGPGDYVGELALLAGHPNAATVRALTAFEAYEVGKRAIAPLLERNQDLLHALEAAAATAQARLDRTIAIQACRFDPSATSLIDRIKLFFAVQ